jgi:hypothetical protein
MNILEIDWQQFLQDLQSFQRLPREARRLFAEQVRPVQPITNAELGEQREVLLASGLLVPGVKAVNASVPQRYRAFFKVVRALYRHRIFDAPSRDVFHRYLSDHFTVAERNGFCRNQGYYYYGEMGLYSRISSPEWLNRFLVAKDTSWEERLRDSTIPRSFFSAGVLTTTQELVRRVMARPSPVPLIELSALYPEPKPALLGASILAGTRYLLLFPALRGEDLEPVLGIWPTITKALHRVPPQPPAPVTPHEIFHAPFLIDDIASLLAACAAEPLRVRRHDYALYARSEQEIAAVLGTLPDWVERDFQVGLVERIDMALTFSKHYEFLKQEGRPGQDLRLEVAEAGECWLRLSAKERLKTLLDGLLGTLKKRSELLDYQDRATSLLPYGADIGYGKQSLAIPSAVLDSYAGLAVRNFVGLREFLAYHVQRSNPLASAARKDPHLTLIIQGSYVTGPDPLELEEAWTGLLRDFLRLRLLPLGGVKVGLHGDQAACFALTEAGQYLVGASPDFDFEPTAARVVVQPNFDVVFLDAAPRAESEIAPFAERTGRHRGTLFRITKRSILAAAAAGLTADQVFATLRQCCSTDLPPNVQREIAGWFAQCRRVTVRPAVLICCPDADTATRLLATAGSKAARITDTTLELLDRKAQPALLRKLREIGIFVRLFGLKR